MNEPAAPLSFARWRTLYQPNRWKIEATGPGGGHVVTFAAPDDRDIGAAFEALQDLEALAPGAWTLQPLLAVKGKGAAIERARLGLAAFQRPEPMTVEVAPASPLTRSEERALAAEVDDMLPPEPEEAPADVLRAEADARRERANAIAAEARAKRAQHEADAAEANAKARQYAAQTSAAMGPADLVAALRAMQEASDARLAQLLQALRPTPPAPPPDPLQQLTQQLGVLREVRAEFERAAPPAPAPVAVEGDNVGAIVLAVARELRPVLQDVIARWPAKAGAPAPAALPAPSAAPSPQLAAAGSAPSAAPNAIAAERVRQFCVAVSTEMQADAEPEAVADRVADLVGLLPGDVRAACDAGDVPQLIDAAAKYLPTDEAEQLRGSLAFPPVVPWLQRLLAALQPEPE